MTPHEDAAHRDRVAELERRITELEGLDESAFGRFSPVDWVVCIVFALLLPVLALVWFAH